MDPTLAPYADMTGDSQVPEQPQSQMAGITHPIPEIVTAMNKPAASPQELESRKAGWQEILKNPNFLRALGFAGAQLAQPIQPGQTKMGHAAQAFITGQTAMQMGDYAQYQQDMAGKEEARKQAESTANVAGTQASTAIKTVQLPGVAADSRVAAETADFRIATEKTRSEKSIFDLGKAKSIEEVDAAQREIDKRKIAIQKEIPDASLRAAAMAEVDAAALKAREARARISASEATAGASSAAAAASGVKTAHEQITVDVLNNMDAQEKKEFLTKTGRYLTHMNSATVARDMYGSIYDELQKSSPADPRIKGKSREQFVLDGITSQKSLDATTSLKNYMTAISSANLDPDPEIVQSLSDQIKTGAKARAGNAAAPGAASPEIWVRDKTGKLVRQSVQNPGPAK